MEAVHRIGQKTSGVWGNHTATIDWCEDNYTHSHYVAEWYNTISNIPFIALGLFGAYSCLRVYPNQRPIPHGARYALAHLGITCIGIGSFIFHSTLKWHAQVLLDELPMIFVVSLVLYLVCADSERWQGSDRWKLKFGLAGVPTLVSALYLYYPNPVLHQVCFAIIDLTATYRTVLLFRTAPKSIPAADLKAAKHYIVSGSLLFILAFAIWNVDNIFCDAWTALRARFWAEDTLSGVGVLVGALTQGHAWWHLLTGLGCSRVTVGMTYLMLSRKYPGAFELTPPVLGLIPVVRWRVGAGAGGSGGATVNAKMNKLS
ncbi:alkaline phytoceramidase [Ceratobasidium sp. AG-I]|nr:alkaline phytoceramidase [Ceratobasidium sp. AG-I]